MAAEKATTSAVVENAAVTNSSCETDCKKCIQYRDRLALAASLLENAAFHRKTLVHEKDMISEKFCNFQTSVLTKIAKLKRELQAVHLSLIELTGNNNKMLARVQGTLYSLQIALRTNKTEDVRKVLLTLQNMSTKLELENESLTRRMQQSELEKRHLRHTIEANKKTIDRLKEEFNKAEQERKLHNELNRKYSDRKVLMNMVEESNEKLKKEKRKLSRKLDEKGAEVETLRLELKEKSKALFIAKAQLKDKEREVMLHVQREKAAESRSQAVDKVEIVDRNIRTPSYSPLSNPGMHDDDKSPLEIQDLSSAPPVKRQKIDFKAVIAAGPLESIEIIQNCSLIECKELICEILAELTDQRQRNIDLDSDVSNLLSAQENYDQKIQRSREELYQLKEEIAILENQSEISSMEMKKTRDLLLMSDETLAANRMEREEMIGEIETLKLEVSDRDRHIDFKSQQMHRMFSDNSKLQENIAAERHEVQNVLQDLDAVRRELAAARTSMTGLREMLRDRDCKIEALQGQLYHRPVIDDRASHSGHSFANHPGYSDDAMGQHGGSLANIATHPGYHRDDVMTRQPYPEVANNPHQRQATNTQGYPAFAEPNRQPQRHHPHASYAPGPARPEFPPCQGERIPPGQSNPDPEHVELRRRMFQIPDDQSHAVCQPERMPTVAPRQSRGLLIPPRPSDLGPAAPQLSPGFERQDDGNIAVDRASASRVSLLHTPPRLSQMRNESSSGLDPGGGAMGTGDSAPLLRLRPMGRQGPETPEIMDYGHRTTAPYGQFNRQ